MKKKISSLVFLVVSIANISFAQQLEWDFPTKPGSEAWKNLKSWNERVNACQIESQKLKTISTSGLVRICSQYPFFSSYGFYDSPIDGFNASLIQFNGYTELMSRENSLQAILSVIEEENFDELKGESDSLKRAYKTLRWIGLEMLLCNDSQIKKLTSEEKNNSIKRILDIYDKKMAYKEDFGGISEAVSCFFSRKLLISMNAQKKQEKLEKQKKLDLFDKTMMTDDELLVQEMMTEVKDYRKKLK